MQVGEWSERLLRGEVQGRVVVKVSEEYDYKTTKHNTKHN